MASAQFQQAVLRRSRVLSFPSKGRRNLWSNIGEGIVGKYATFPATLYHFSPERRAKFWDKTDNPLYETDVEYHVHLKEGLVHPLVEEFTQSNGPVFMPNTVFMQESSRVLFEHLQLRKLNPFIFKVAKGTPIPKTLQLLREHESRFSLQPSLPIPLPELNHLLHDFFERHATETPAGEWFEQHPWDGAFDDYEVEAWMAV